ncbi:MAG: EamA family transporter [Candidatus Latescibacteria bacterium]|nr:EamA family transporter [Candidatus Latescibacterota bacterium]
MMSPLVYTLICILMWGIAVFVMKLAGTRLDPVTTVVFNMFGYVIMGSFLLPHASFTLTRAHVLAVVIGPLFIAGNMAFYKLSQANDISTIAPLTALNVVIPIILGILFLGEPLTLRKGLGILLAVGAIYLLS